MEIINNVGNSVTEDEFLRDRTERLSALRTRIKEGLAIHFPTTAAETEMVVYLRLKSSPQIIDDFSVGFSGNSDERLKMEALVAKNILGRLADAKADKP